MCRTALAQSYSSSLRCGLRDQQQRSSIKCAASQQQYVGGLDASGLRFAIVAARFNELVTKLLLAGAQDAFARHGGPSVDVILPLKP